MRVEKVINNNVVEATDQNNKQYVLMGKGLGFNKKKGDLIDRDSVERMFVAKDNDALKESLGSLSEEATAIVLEVLEKAEKELDQVYSESLILSLSDHISFMFLRLEKGYPIVNPLHFEVRRLYPEEYKIGLYAVERLSELTEYEIPKTEASSIALHLINSQRQASSLSQTYQSVSLIEEIVRIVELSAGKPLDKNSTNYQRFLTHLNFFVQRVLNNEQTHGGVDGFLKEQIEKSYPTAKSYVDKIVRLVEDGWNYQVNPEEKIYLTIHIARLIKE